MSAIWYCEIEGKQHGPLTAGQLRQLAVAGKLQPTHSVWKEGMTTKAQARSVNGLFNGIATPSAPAAPKKAAPVAKKPESLDELECIETIEDEETPDLVELETIETPKPKKKKVQEEVEEIEEIEDEPEVVAEVEVVYREGHPDVEGPLEGKMILDTKGLRFVFEDDDEEFYIKFDKIESVMEPAKGDFSPSTHRKATAAKVGGAVGKVAAGLLGKLIGDTAGEVVSKVGSSAADMAKGAGDLGKPPRNRFTLKAILRKKKCRFIFDVDGKTREEMNDEAKVLYKQITRTQKKAQEAAAPVETIEEISEVEEMDDSAEGADVVFRVKNGDEISGPYPLSELRSMIASGDIAPDASLKIEGWVPISLLGSGGDEEIAEDNYEVVDEEEETPTKPMAPKPAAKPSAPKPVAAKVASAPQPDDGGSLKVDAEFQLD